MARKFRDMSPGTRVRWSGKWLKSTGARDGRRVYTVQACDCGLCAGGRHVALDEPSFDGDGLRHAARDNLTVVGQLDHRNAL